MKQFAIICHNRCGSNFLKCELNLHPEIHCLGEIYQELEIEKLTLNNDILKNRQENPIEYINCVYKSINSSKPIIGCKLLFPVVEWSTLEKIIQSPDITFIFLYRKNILESVISELLAFKTNQWYTDKTIQPIIPDSFNMNIEEIEKRIQEKAYFISYFKRKLKNSFQITYEELFDKNAINKVCSALSVQPVSKLYWCLEKQTSEKTYESILNRKEIENRFGETYGYLGKSSPDDISKIKYWN